MRKLTILVDMDDTIEQLLKAWLDQLNERYGTSVECEDILDWDMTKAFPTLTKEQVYGITLEYDFWKRVTPIDGAVEGLKRFIDAGHTIYIVTVADYRTIESKMDNVLFKYFPFISWNNVIIISKKQLLHADVLIDDGVHNLIDGDFKRILVDAPYNRQFNEKEHDMIRVHNWAEIESAVNDIAGREN